MNINGSNQIAAWIARHNAVCVALVSFMAGFGSD